MGIKICAELNSKSILSIPAFTLPSNLPSDYINIQVNYIIGMRAWVSSNPSFGQFSVLFLKSE